MPTTASLPVFLEHRRRLTRLAYRYLGSVADAEDVVQEAWLRFEGAQPAREPARFLSTIVTRLCLDRLKSARHRREVYVGEWLPEPVVGEPAAGEGDTALDISFAVMRALERLSPAERAAFFLHDLWDLPFEEVGEVLARSPEACRKLASRARRNLTDARQRFKPSALDVERLADALKVSVETGDPGVLKAMLAADAELVTDGGGKVLAARNVIHGADAVARFLVGVASKSSVLGEVVVTHADINDAPGMLVLIGGVLDQTFAFDLDEAGLVRAIYVVRNPDKLRAVGGRGRAVIAATGPGRDGQ